MTIPSIDPESARIDGLVARAARVAVIFRRGPSRSTRLLSWDLHTDVVTAGQWLRGRIYSRRCDLSPKGDLLAYFAASFRKPHYSWTAVSRPPFLTALALWPKGDCWGGGALFDSARCLKLNHRPSRKGVGPDEMALADGCRLPKGFRVEPLHERAGWGEDDPISQMRFLRDGWLYDSTPIETRSGGKALYWRFEPPLVRRKKLPRARSEKAELELRVLLHGIGENQGRWYAETADIVDSRGEITSEIGRVDWADVDHTGDVLFARAGCLFRLRRKTIDDPAGAVLVADLSAMKFEAIASPLWARRW